MNHQQLQNLETELHLYTQKCQHLFNNDNQATINHLNDMFPSYSLRLENNFFENFINSDFILRPLNKTRLIHYYRNNSLSIRDIAKLTKKAPNTVQKVLKEPEPFYSLSSDAPEYIQSLESLHQQWEAKKHFLDSKGMHLI